MGKYDKLWKYLKENSKDEYLLSFEDIAEITGFSIDHSFLNYKKEASLCGYEVKKISLKRQTVLFVKL